MHRILQIISRIPLPFYYPHDLDEQKWIDYEITGYPPVFDPAELGTCQKYFTSNCPVLRDDRLRKTRPIGQLVFYTTERAQNPYFSKGDAKYLDQRQATLPRYHANKKD